MTYSTRNSKSYRSLSCRTNIKKFSKLFQGPKIWNSLPTIMDKSLVTNLHLWRFFTCAKQTITREFIYTCSVPPSSPPPPTPYNVGHVYTLFLQSFNIVLGGRAHVLKRITVLFENSVLKTQKIHTFTQVYQGLLSRIVAV